MNLLRDTYRWDADNKGIHLFTFDSNWPSPWFGRETQIKTHTHIKVFKVNLTSFEEWRLSPHPRPPASMTLLHFLTLVFSSSPCFLLLRSPECAAGQTAAAGAQPIWNAAPPSWRSEWRGERQSERGREQTGGKPQGTGSNKLFTCIAKTQSSLLHAYYVCNLQIDIAYCYSISNWVIEVLSGRQLLSDSKKLTECKAWILECAQDFAQVWCQSQFVGDWGGLMGKLCHPGAHQSLL